MPENQESLMGFAARAERHWKEYRPKMWERLKAAGLLRKHLEEAGESALDMFHDLVNKGTDPEAAREMALYEYILLPDIGEGEPTPMAEPIPEMVIARMAPAIAKIKPSSILHLLFASFRKRRFLSVGAGALSFWFTLRGPQRSFRKRTKNLLILQ